MSLEKRKLQGLLGLVEKQEAASPLEPETDMSMEKEASRAQELPQSGSDGCGLEGAEGLVEVGGGVGGRAGDGKGAASAADPDTDETDREVKLAASRVLTWVLVWRHPVVDGATLASEIRGFEDGEVLSSVPDGTHSADAV